MKGGLKVLALLPWLVAALAAPATAALIGFGDRTSWETAASGGVLHFEDFESFNSDTSFSDSAVTLTDDITLGEIGGVDSTDSVNLIDTTETGFLFGGANAIDGDAYALLWARTPKNPVEDQYEITKSTFVQIEFDDPISAFGADFNRTSTIGMLVYLLPVGESTWVACEVCSIGAGESFMGFVGDDGELFSSLLFIPSVPSVDGGGARVGMDNVAWATTPEPQTAVLLGLGLAGVAVVGRRRR